MKIPVLPISYLLMHLPFAAIIGGESGTLCSAVGYRLPYHVGPKQGTGYI